VDCLCVLSAPVRLSATRWCFVITTLESQNIQQPIVKGLISQGHEFSLQNFKANVPNM